MTLTFLKQIPMWIFVVVFSRDLLIVLGWSVIWILTGSAAIETRKLGKTTTAIQMGTVLAAIIPLPVALLHILLWFCVAMTVASAVDYIIVGEKKLGAWN